MSLSFYKYVIKAPPVIFFLTGCFFSGYILSNLNEDTTRISNVAFGITAILASLCLRFPSLSIVEENLKDRFLFCTERFFHASLLLLSASIIKYSVISIRAISFFQNHKTLVSYFTLPLGILVAPLFLFAVMEAHTGIRIVNEILWSRINRYKDWNKLF